MNRRKFLKVGTVLGVGLGGGALVATRALTGGPRAEWATDRGIPWETVRIRVHRGTAPVGTAATLRVLLDDGGGERELARVPVALDAERTALDYSLPYPFEGLRDATLRYTLALAVPGADETRSEPLVVEMRRYRFGV